MTRSGETVVHLVVDAAHAHAAGVSLEQGAEIALLNRRVASIIVAKEGEELGAFRRLCGSSSRIRLRKCIRRDDDLDELVSRNVRPYVRKVRLVDLGVERAKVLADDEWIGPWESVSAVSPAQG